MAFVADVSESKGGRRLCNAADYPTCNIDRSKWPSDTIQACTAEAGDLNYIKYTNGQALIRKCESAACMQLAAIMKVDNPNECVRVYGSTTLVLYQDLLIALDETCRQLNASKDTEPLATTPPQSAPAPTTSTSAETPQPQPRTASPATRTPMSKNPSSSGGNDEGGSASGDSSRASSSPPGARSPTSRTPAPPSSTIVPFYSSSSSSSSSSSTPSSGNDASLVEAAQATTAPGVPKSTSTSSPNSSAAGLIVGLSVGAIIVLAAVIMAIVRKRRRRDGLNTDRSNPAADKEIYTTLESEPSEAHEQYTRLTPHLKQLNDWRIDSHDLVDAKVLGTGAQGSVHLVTLEGSRQLASKRLITDQLTSQRLNGFIAEIQIVAGLKHPSIVQFVGVAWTTAADLQALFEFMPNGDLHAHLDNTKPAQPEPWTRQKLTMALQIAEGLVFMHSFYPPVVHRDLKARNILLDSEMNAKISDFGVSRSQSEQGTMTTGIGTSRWLAPEVIMGGGGYTEQCDIYAFGVVLTEIDTHELPFADERLAEIELMHRVGTGTIRAKTSPQCDSPIRELIDQCLSVDPSERPNALELTYRLRKAVRGLFPDQ